MNSKILQPIEDDHMPYQVATSLLFEPKAKMSNRMRKNCKSARETVYSSLHPVLRDEAGNFVISTMKAKPTEQRILERMKKATTPQLQKWTKRIIARRRNVQEKYLKTQDKAGPHWDQIRATLEAIARQCDMTRDIMEDILTDRFQHYLKNYE